MIQPITTIDTDSERGSWAETLASPSCKVVVVEGLHPLVRFYCQRNGIALDHEAIPAMNAAVLEVFATDDGSDHVFPIQQPAALTLPLRPTVAFVGSPNRGIEVPPVNSPAVTDNQGGGHCGSFHHHEADNG